MDKLNPLLPFAFSSSSASEKIPLNTTPRDRDIIDENASSMYHTRNQRSLMDRPLLRVPPSLKRKGGESFNEKDDVKRRDMDYEDTSSEPTFVDDNATEEFNYKAKTHRMDMTNEIPPSSPPADFPIESELDMSTNFDTRYEVPCSPSQEPTDYKSDQNYAVGGGYYPKLLPNNSSDADFGIDMFNRFKDSAANECPSTDQDTFESEDYKIRQKRVQQRAREIVLSAFEDIQTTISLEGMGLVEVPDEIQDFNNLVIFNADPSSQISFQLYLTNNSIRTLPPSLFKFTKLNVLGLRQNKLTRIPNLIGKLHNLVDLSLGTNRLTYLPSLILDLTNLQIFRAGPNPYIQVSEDAQPILTSTYNSYKMLKFVSPIIKQSHRDCDIPSLKTLCLDVIARHDVSYQETKNWKRYTPSAYHNLIAKAIANGRYEEKCDQCDLIIVDPFAEVIEWWDILQNKNVPIKRFFCSGMCANKWKKRIIELSDYK